MNKLIDCETAIARLEYLMTYLKADNPDRQKELEELYIHCCNILKKEIFE